MNLRRTGVGIAALSVAAIVVGCGSNKTTVQSPPTQGSYDITFPSPAAAVATDTIQVLVFDASGDAGNLCFSLVEKRKSHQDLPTALQTGQPTPVCSLRGGPDAGASGGAISLGYGAYAFLAIGQRQGQDFMLGCALGNFSESSSTVNIAVAPADLTSNPVPTLPSTCDPNAPLTQHCDPANASKCSP